jgi:hypothetical protein
VADETILWRKLDQPGHESARLSSSDSRHYLMGTAVFAHNEQPCRLDYVVVCSSKWQSLSGTVAGWIGSQSVEIALAVDSDHRWRLNGAEYPEVAGCIDLDLNFSPSTNLLPIRRLNLAIGEQAVIRAAWLHFPKLTLEPLEQLYRRIGPATYRFESGGGEFVTELRVNAAGFVIHYPNLWEVEASI